MEDYIKKVLIKIQKCLFDRMIGTKVRVEFRLFEGEGSLGSRDILSGTP